MSNVTSVIVSGFAGCYPAERGESFVIDALNAYTNQNQQGELCRVDHFATGGNKHVGPYVWMGAFNYLDVDEYTKVFCRALLINDAVGDCQMLINRDDEIVFNDVSPKRE